MNVSGDREEAGGRRAQSHSLVLLTSLTLWRNYKVLTSNAHLPWTESKCFDYRKKKENFFMHRIDRPRDENNHFNNMEYVAWKSFIQPELFGQFDTSWQDVGTIPVT